MKRRQLPFSWPVLFGAVAAVIGMACYVAPTPVGSRFVKSVAVNAQQGATLSITAADDAELAGTTLVIEPGALSHDEVVTVELGGTALASDGHSPAGPVAIFGPDGLEFSKPATLTLPLALATGQQPATVIIEGREGDGTRFVIPHDRVEVAANEVRFRINGFTSFQPASSTSDPADAGTPCQSDSDCVQGEACTNGKCVVSSAGCHSDSECASDERCSNGACVVRSGPCHSDADCAPGDACTSDGACVTPPPPCVAATDGGADSCANGMTCDPADHLCKCGGVTCDDGTFGPPVEVCVHPQSGTEFCAVTCDPRLANNCAAGTYCYFDELNPPYCAAPTDSKGEGEDCWTPFDCVAQTPVTRSMFCADLHHLPTGSPGSCRLFCSTTVGSAGCPFSSVPRDCVPLVGGPTGLGYCAPIE